jgi:hypothetical protein
MTEALTPDEREERQARIDQLIAGAILALKDSQKREQDIRYAPLTLLATGVGAGAALTVALTTVAAFLLKWLEH